MGLSSFASKRDRGGRRREPADVLPDLLGGLARGDRGARRARAGGRRGGADRHARLDVLPRARLGQPVDPERARPARRWRRLAPEVLARPRWLVPLGAGRAAARRSSVPNMVAGAAPGVLRRLRRVDADAAAVLGGPRAGCASSGTARSCSRASCASTTRGAPSTTSARPRSRSPTTAATTSTARRRRSARCPRSPRRSATQVEVLLDGGIRRGSDVVKALALGARAVMIGRAYLWGLAADGQAGVENVLDVLRSGIDSALLGLGQRPRSHELDPGRPADPRWLRPPARPTRGSRSSPAPPAGSARRRCAALVEPAGPSSPSIARTTTRGCRTRSAASRSTLRARRALRRRRDRRRQLAAAVALAEERFGGLDAIVAAAGVIAGGVPPGSSTPSRSGRCSTSTSAAC